METRTVEMVVAAVPNQFWGAIKIFTEKPHVINRRICGTTNLWIGVCEERDYNREKVLASVLDAIESETSDEERNISQEKDFTSVLNATESESNDEERKFSKEKDFTFVQNANGPENSNEEEQGLQEFTLKKKIENNIDSELECENENTSGKLNTSAEKADELLQPSHENNLENDIGPQINYSNVNKCELLKTSDKKNSEIQKSALGISIENHIYSGTDCSKSNVNISHTNLSLLQKKLEDGCFKSLSNYDVAKVEDDCEASNNDNNDDDNDEGESAIETDHVARFQNECKASENDNNNEDEMGHQKASRDYSKGKLVIPWGCLAKTSNTVAVVRKILPKQADKFASVLEVILLDGARKGATYITETKSSRLSINPKVNYTVALTSAGISMSCLSGGKQEGDPSVTWLTKNVLPKVAKWAAEVAEDGRVDDRGSLKLVDVAEYNEVYQRLKIKYGKPLVKMWPEVTDPLKFVYEDIAIATYLLLLWRHERQRRGLASPQSFVDLGCGNGLLVYILAGEGHRGLGIDVKRRKIWDLFPSHVELKEATIEPSDKHLFPEHDWLIGNHSDELTPWIPVMAAKSSYDTRFLVIPCCAHDFSQKYRRRHAGRSQYSDYLEYVKEIGAVCGFNVKQDKLRIPSTKRICLVGEERTIDASASSEVSLTIDAFIKERTEATKELSDEADVKCNSESSQNRDCGGLLKTEMWTEGFKAREGVQPVRNCTQLKRSVREDIISAIVGVLMEKKHLVEVNIGSNETPTTVAWDRGGSMTLGDLARRLDRLLLAAMKKECGGLQTLLKNHRYIFSLCDGLVSLQVPQQAWTKKTTPNTFTKTKLCWFHAHHRSGCPLPAPMCLFAHGEEDMRSKEGSEGQSLGHTV